MAAGSTVAKKGKKAPSAASSRRASSSKKRASSSRSKSRRKRWVQTWTASTYADSGSRDKLEGEDPVARAAAVAALGPLNGSIVVVDPSTGRLLSVVNQEVAFGHGYQPCSTIKLPVALAALLEGVVDKDTPVKLGRRWSLNMTQAIAKSNNVYFEMLGRRIGFDKVSHYARQFGFGELAGYNIPEEKLGAFPQTPPENGGVGRLCSFGEDIDVTPLQLAAFVSAIANGGKLFYLQYPRTQEEKEAFEPRIKRHLNIEGILPKVREGMTEAVQHGTARRLENPYAQVLGKTGTCSEGGTRLGWFASYENRPDPRLAVIVLLRGGRPTVGPLAAEVAGRVYRFLHEQNFYARYEQENLPNSNRTLIPATAILPR